MIRYLDLLGIISILIMGFSCQSNKVENQLKNQYIQVEEEPIKCNSFFDLIESIQCIPLETNQNALIGSVSSVDYFNDIFYLMDLLSKSVFLFDKEGSLINTINTVGHGPMEYTDLFDVAVNPYQNELVLADAMQKKVLRFDRLGHPIDELLLDFRPYGMGFIDDSTYCFKTFIEKPVVITTNRRGEQLKVAHTGKIELDVQFFGHFFNYNGIQIYKENLNDTIFQVLKDTCAIRYYIDFMDSKLNATDYSEMISAARQQHRPPNIPQNKSGRIRAYLENDQSVNIAFSYKGKYSSLFYFKGSGKKVIFENDYKTISQLCYLLLNPRECSEDGTYFKFISAVEYLELIDQPDFQELENQGKVKKPSLAIAKINENSNPVLISWNVKPIN